MTPVKLKQGWNVQKGRIGFQPVPIAQRIAERTRTNGDCIEWVGPLEKGYARIWVNGRGVPVHRVSYEMANGPIPQGMVIDHLCRNRACINPAHLEPVTPSENTRRGNSFSAVNARKTECIYGHPLSGDNIVVRNGQRICRTCARKHNLAHKARRRAEGRVA